MKKKTDLKKCKEIAELFLYLEFEETELGSLFVNHPFTNSPVYHDNERNLVDMRENKEAYDNFIKGAKRMIEAVSNYEGFLSILNKPYFFEFLKHTKQFVSKEDVGHYLSNAWIRNEYANMDNGTFTKKQLKSMYEDSPKESLMNLEEMIVLDKMPQQVRIYRGVTSYNDKDISKMSWTLSKEVAKRFATRFNQTGKIYSTTINKSDIFAYFDSRKEQEVIVNYEKLKDVSLYKDFEKKRVKERER